MNNKEPNNFSNTDDFEIVDIPMEQETEKPTYDEMPQAVEIPNPVVESNQSDISSNNVGMNQQGYTEMNQSNIMGSFNEIKVPNDPLPSVENESTISNTDFSMQENINQTSFNEIPLVQEQINPNSNVYIPKKEVKQSDELPKDKLDKSTKEMITMGIIVALVVLLLPTLYNLTTGKYHVMDKIKDLFGGNKTTEIKEEVPEDEEEVEEESEEKTEENVDSLTFDFSTYQNQVVKTNTVEEILNNYQNNLVNVTATLQNNMQTITIILAEDMENVESLIKDPITSIQKFRTQYLTTQLNYLMTVTDNSDGTITLTAVQQ